MSDLVVIVPSRGRPHTVAEISEAFEQTCTARTVAWFAVDNDDAEVEAYAAAAGGRAYVAPADNISMVDALNRAAVYFASGAEGPAALGFMGDDHRPRTEGWDRAYLDALDDLGTGIVYGNDLYQGERIPTQCAMTTDIIRTLGYMAPPDLKHMYVDNAWLALGRAMGRIRYLPDVVIEHMHPVAEKAEWDEGYARVNAPEVYRRDQAVYERWLMESLPAEAARLRRLVA